MDKSKKSLKRKGKGSGEDDQGPAPSVPSSAAHNKKQKVSNDSVQESIVSPVKNKVSKISDSSLNDKNTEAVSIIEDSDSEDIHSNSYNKSSTEQEVIVILDGAQLETVKTKKGDFQLLNCDDHINLMRKHHKDPQQYRPDIIHQVHLK